MTSTRNQAALLCCLLATGGCSGGQADMDRAREVSATGDVGQLSAGGRDIGTRAVEVLAAKLNVPMASISVDSVRAVEWRDSSIGCPQPGEAYMQVITPGHRITLRHDGNLYFVHEAGGRAFVCERLGAAKEPGAPLSLDWGPMAMEARRDLAARLGVEEQQVIIAGTESTTFTDESLGCPEPDVDYETGRLEGYVLRLRYGSRNYTYHTDLERVIPCPAISVD